MKKQEQSRTGLTSRQLAKRSSLAQLAWQNSLRDYPNKTNNRRVKTRFRSTVPTRESAQDERGNIQASQKVTFQALVLTMLKGLFNPPEELGSDISGPSDEMVRRAVDVLGDQQVVKKAREQVGDTPDPTVTHPSFSADESLEKQAAISRAAISMRPEYFEESVGEASSAATSFFQEFVQAGPMSGWKRVINEKAEKIGEGKEDEKLKAIKKLTAGFSWLCETLAKKDSPIDCYADPAELEEARQLWKWLEDHQPDNPEYSAKYKRFQVLDLRISLARKKAEKELDTWLHSMMTAVDPEYSKFTSNKEYLAYQQRNYDTEDRHEFSDFMLNLRGKEDILEPSKLRAFYEALCRNQQAELFYQFVSESTLADHSEDEAHKIAKLIWMVSQLDTIHVRPKEARSRMPGASFDGDVAPNFGYRLANSVSYQNWLKQGLMRSCANIVMDSFHNVVDFGQNIDIRIFVNRVVERVYESTDKRRLAIKRNGQYDVMAISLAFYLLKKVYNIKFIDDGEHSVTIELAKAAGSKEALAETVREVLTQFKNFCNGLFTLRPGVTEESLLGPFVFGIGFNGPIFECPSHSRHDENEIWLAFSESARHAGGNAFLFFLSDFASSRNFLENNKNRFTEEWMSKRFNHYQALIKYQVNVELKKIFKFRDYSPSAKKYEEKQSKFYESLLAQLEEKIPFSNLAFEHQQWIRDPNNWYYIPSTRYLDRKNKISINVADPLTEAEQGAQQLTRHLIFDVFCREDFISGYPELACWLFLHWRPELQELAELLKPQMVDKVSAVSDYQHLSLTEKEEINLLLNSLVKHIHDEIADVWKPEIDKQFDKYRQEKRKQQLDKVKEISKPRIKIESEITRLRLLISRDSIKDKSDLSRKIVSYEKALSDLPPQPMLVPVQATVSELTADEYNKFKLYFFANRGVAQCIEPSFSKVLGHDRFLPVYIAREMGYTVISDPLADVASTQLLLGNQVLQSVIPPCDKRCQHHALGHLYTGDMLSAQSMDRLNTMRVTHNFPKAPFRLFPLPATARKRRADEEPCMSDSKSAIRK